MKTETNQIIIHSDSISGIKLLDIDLLVSFLPYISLNIGVAAQPKNSINVNYQTLQSYVTGCKTKWVLTGDSRLANRDRSRLSHLINIYKFLQYDFISSREGENKPVRVLEFTLMDTAHKLTVINAPNGRCMIYVDCGESVLNRLRSSGKYIQTNLPKSPPPT